MSGFLFLIFINWIIKKGIKWKVTTILEDLYFADDIALLSSRLDHAQDKLSRLYQFGRNEGLKISTEKTKVLRLNTARPDPLKLRAREVEDVESFVSLGAKVNNTAMRAVK